MTPRSLAIVFSTLILGGCVTSGGLPDPMKTSQGRADAVQAYVQLGIGYLQSGETEKAKKPLRQALDLDSHNVEALAALALVFQAEMEPKLAEESYRKALSERPNDARLLNNYGSFLFGEKKYQEARDTFTKAAEDTLYAERSRVFENLARTELMLKQPAKAEQHLQKSLRLNHQQPSVLLSLAQLNFDKKNYVQAREYYDGFLSLNTDQNAASLLLGARLAKVFDDRNQAATYGLQLKRRFPGTPELRQYQAEQ